MIAHVILAVVVAATIHLGDDSPRPTPPPSVDQILRDGPIQAGYDVARALSFGAHCGGER